MTIKIGKTILIGFFLLLTTACVTVSRNAGQSVQEIQDTLPTLVDQLNQLQILESNLQLNWQEDIQTDATLSSYNKKEGRVFENIKQRRALLNEIKNSLKILNTDSQHLSNLKDKNLPSAEIQIVVSNIKTIYDTLTQYEKLCTEQLNKEEQFFTNLANQTHDRDSLALQIKTLNEAADERQALLKEMNTPLSDIDKPIRILKARLTSTN